MKMMAFRTFLRFCVVGVAGFLIDASALYAAAPLLGWYAARVLSFLAAATGTWWLNRHYTFATESNMGAKAKWRQYLGYLHLMMLGGIVNYLVYAATIVSVKVSAAPIMGVALGSCAGLLVNFLSARSLFSSAASAP